MTLPEPQFPAVEIIVDPQPMGGEFNMAMDAALLELSSVRDKSVARIYRWKTPTVTLGYFQAAMGGAANPFTELPCVRRLSGGGAILHDDEITYSCILPASHPARSRPSDLYGKVHRNLIVLLNQCGAMCLLRDEHSVKQTDQPDSEPLPKAIHHPIQPPSADGRSAEDFLCFLRSDPNDIVSSCGTKIVGSAQRRRKGVILQHGSILLSSSKLTPRIPGIRELFPRFQFDLFADQISHAVAAAIGNQWTFRDYTEEERAAATAIHAAVEHPQGIRSF